MECDWSTTDLSRIFALNNRQTLTNAEKNDRIPTAKRKKRGASDVRYWSTAQLPDIGKIYGPFRHKPLSTIVICVYIKKGGVLKTTVCHTLARVLALNGLKVLIVGLDSQLNMTNLVINPLYAYANVDDLKVYKGLYEYLVTNPKLSLKDIILQTDLPTLDLIPENFRLEELPEHITTMDANTSVFAERIRVDAEKLGYDVVLFDNSPNFDILSKNAIYASDFLISPAACEPACYQALEFNLNRIEKFLRSTRKEIQKHFLLPTQLDAQSKVSCGIASYYKESFPSICTSSSIRRTTKGSQAYVYGQTPIETDPLSVLAQDYFNVIKEIWTPILDIKGRMDAEV